MAGKKSDSKIRLDFLLIDIFALFLSFAVSYRIKFGNLGFVKSETWLLLVFTVLLIDVIICLFSNPYHHILTRPYYEEILRSLILAFYNLISVSVIFYIFKIGSSFSRQTVLLMFVLYFLLSLVLKCLWKWMILSKKIRPLNSKKAALMILTDESDIAGVIRNATAGDMSEYELKAICAQDFNGFDTPEGVQIVSGFDSFAKKAIEYGIDDVLVALNPSKLKSADIDLLIKNDIGVHYSIESLTGVTAESYDVSTVGVYNTMGVGKYEFTQGQIVYLAVKRVIDLVAGVIGLIALLPVTAVIKLICVFSGDKGSIFYKQQRIGKNGKPIMIYKYRTMITDADKKLEELLKDEKFRAEWDANQKLSNDPRITKAGRFLRKTSIDELPQIINVVKGEMSIVGPRPLVEGELEAHGGMKLYQQVKPGITGWWGCNGRSNIEYNERLELEYYYIRNFSVYLDFLCVLRTVMTVMGRKGAI